MSVFSRSARSRRDHPCAQGLTLEPDGEVINVKGPSVRTRAYPAFSATHYPKTRTIRAHKGSPIEVVAALGTARDHPCAQGLTTAATSRGGTEKGPSVRTRAHHLFDTAKPIERRTIRAHKGSPL